jgi:hypothetical protein
MASLTGQLVAETYKALLKTIDNDILTASEKQITDGFGGGSNVFIDSQGFLRANKYKVTNGLATQFLKADGSLDSNTYLTGITSSQIISALGYTPVPTTRTLTINGTTYDLSANRSWTIDGTSAVWGNISGTLSNQTDLQNALNAKFNNPTGTISQYIRGDGSLATFPTLTGFVPYTGATANVDLGEFSLSAEYLAIDTDTTHSTDVGEIVWNPIDGTFDMGLLNDVVLQAGQELHFYGKASGAIGNGKAVMFAGVEGDHLLMSLADPATINANPQYFIGVSTQDFANNDFGYVTILGKVRNLDTTAFTLGSVLYFDSANATDGLLTETQPIAPNAKIEVAAVVRVHATQGTLMVRPHIMPKMSMIQDVYIADPANNHGLFYDLANGYWENKSIASALGYTPQAQLDGTGFVKASGTTISYDNSTYLTTTDAASTYQRLDKMVSNLLASATEYPNSNAVINALALKADALNPVFTGYMTISGAEPKLYFTDTDQNPDYFIGADGGFFRIYDQTAGATRFVINSSGVTTIAGDLIVGTIAKSGGTATQFLKADGSIDSSTYVTSASLANYLLITTAASTYQRLDKMVSNLLASDTEYPNSNAVLAKLALKADAANPVFTGDMTISGIAPKLYFTDTDNNPDYTLFVDSGYFYIYDQTAGATKFQITPSGNAINTGTLTSASFIKSGGTSSQYLMADGSVSTLSGLVTGSGSTNYLPKWTSGSGISNSIIYELNSKIHIGTTTESSYKLEVNAGAAGGISVSNAAAVLSLNLYNSTNNAIARFTSTTNAFWDLQANTDGTFQIDRSDISVLTFATTGAAIFVNSIKATRYLITPSGTSSVYNIVDSDQLFAGSYNLQAGGGSAGYGGSLVMYGHSHASRAGYVSAGISTGSGGRFTVMNGGNGAGTDVFSVLQNGNVLVGTTTDSGYKFDVNGTGRFSDNLRISKSSNSGSGSAFPRFTVQNTLSTQGDGSSTYNFADINISSGNEAVNMFLSTTYALGNWSPAGIINVASNHPLIFKTNNTEVIRITNDAAMQFANSIVIKTIGSSGYIATYANGGGLYWGGVASTNQMHLNQYGNLGIGTTSQNNKLQVGTNGALGSWMSATFQDGIGIAPSGSRAATYLYSDGSSLFGLNAYDYGTGQYKNISIGWGDGTNVILSQNNGKVLIGTTTDSGWKLYVNGGSTDALKLYNSGGVQSMNIENTTNNVIMRLVSSTNTFWDIQANTNGTFHIDRGDVTAFLLATSGAATFSSSVTATAFFESSDFRLKKIIEHNHIVDGIENLEAKLYEKNGKIELGYFAQDAEKLMPYAVTKGKDGFLTLSYREVHTAKIARLEKRVAELEKQLNLN